MTANATATPLESQLAELLGELSSVQADMLNVLAAKRDCMADGDLSGMTELQPAEQALCARLQACHDRRGQLLLAAAEEGLPSDSLDNLASRFATDSNGELGKQVKESSVRMRLLQHQSLTNWVLAQRSMLHLSQLLEIVATGGRLQPTYGRDDSPISSGALVDEDA